MYVRTISRQNKDGSTTTYVQLAHNVRDPKTGFARANVLYTFGRADSLDIEAIKRLVKSLCRFLTPEEALRIQANVGGEFQALRFVKSSPMGGAFVLRILWERLGLQKALVKSLQNREFRSPMEWAIFAMVANRALAPDSKRGVEEWVREDVALGNPETISLQHLYRAMDFLLEHEELIQKEIFFATADLLNLEVDLLFFDTTTTYVERDEEAPHNPMYFSVKDAEGFEYNTSLASKDPSLKSGNLAKGDKARGFVCFEVSKEAKGFVVEYEPIVILGGYKPIRVDLGI